jgi:DNA-binding winged helix-turn-helix (wHTH) protein
MRRDSSKSSLPSSGQSRGGAALVWTFLNWRIDEANRLISRDGSALELEAKPFDLLVELLRHAGEVVTKTELLDAIWPDVTVVEGSLTTALSKLRKTLGDTDNRIIVTVPRIGYRFAVPVEIHKGRAARNPLAIEPGSAVPGRPNWRYVERIGQSSLAEVWRISHEKTRVEHVLKLTADADGLRALKREIAVVRLFQESLGDRPDFVPALDWNFSEAPFFVESNFAGVSLGTWAATQGDLSEVPLALRLELVAKIATTVAAAHSVGVLHKDLKPDNILIAVDRNGHWQPKVVDFGSAFLMQPDRLTQLGITHTATKAEAEGIAGTTPWLAPELFSGHAPSLASDVYALGVLLYQLICGDLRRPLATGWEQQIGDPILRTDIAAATAGTPEDRLDSAAELARRLRSLDERRREADFAELAANQIRQAEEKLTQIRTRRPWVIAAGIALILGTGISTLMAFQAAHERDKAIRQTRITDSVNGFLANDLLARSSPFRSGAPNETFVEAVTQASPLIDRRFVGEPTIAAGLHQTIANAFDKRSSWVEARAEYERAGALWKEAGKKSAADAVINELQHAMMEARAYQDNSLDKAKSEIAEAELTIKSASIKRPDVAVWLASAKGMVALIGNDAKEAQSEFQIAVDGASRLPEFEAPARLNFRQRLAFTKIRLGDGLGAEEDFRALALDYSALEGESGPNVLQSRLNVIQALMIGSKHEAVVKEANSLYPQLEKRLGSDHEMTLQLLMTRAQSEGMLERWADAMRDDLHAHEVSTQKMGPHSFFAVASLVDAATAQCRGGQVRAGLRNANQAYTDSLAGFGKVALTDAARFTVAECKIGLEMYAEAAKDLATINADEVAQLAGDPNWGANVELEKARIAIATNDKSQARRYLKPIEKVYAAPGVDPYQSRLYRDLLAKSQ